MWSTNSVTLIVKISTNGTFPGTIFGSYDAENIDLSKIHQRSIKDQSALSSRMVFATSYLKGISIFLLAPIAWLKKRIEGMLGQFSRYIRSLFMDSFVCSSPWMRAIDPSKTQNSLHQLVFGSYRNSYPGKSKHPCPIHGKSSVAK